jgi:hypothetical protein
MNCHLLLIEMKPVRHREGQTKERSGSTHVGGEHWEQHLVIFKRDS